MAHSRRLVSHSLAPHLSSAVSQLPASDRPRRQEDRKGEEVGRGGASLRRDNQEEEPVAVLGTGEKNKKKTVEVSPVCAPTLPGEPW